MSTSTPAEEIVRRIRAEYIEMPGLRVTQRQAQRLWGLDATTCHLALQHLIETRFLCLMSGDHYARLTEGPAAFPAPRMAKATLTLPTHRRAVIS
jgi:hypothetical protein